MQYTDHCRLMCAYWKIFMENTSSKKTIGIVVILVIIIVGILLMMKKSAPVTVSTSPTNTAQTNQPVAPAPDTSPAGLIKSSGTATASLEQDSASVDAELKGLNSDTTSANQAVQ